MGTLFRRTRNAKKSSWIAEYTLHTGRRRQRSTGTGDKKTASQILAHWETEEAKRASGFVDPRLERFAIQASRQIDDHLTEFIDSLKTAGRADVHVTRTEKRIETIRDHQGWVTLRCLTPESLDKFVRSLRDLDRSNQTVSHYVQAAKQFARWASRTGRLPSNPLETTAKPNPKADRRRIRRMLLPAEWPWLRDASGPRALLYETAIQTGLRASEIRNLHPAKIKHDTNPPFILIASGDTKDNQLARQYVTRDLADRLARAPSDSKSRFFAMAADPTDQAEQIRADLATARGAWLARDGAIAADAESDFLLATNHEGERLDFHALRHTCGAWLAIQSVHPKTIQVVMRHASITLTMDTYGHLFPDAEPDAINKLGALLVSQ